ncbi:pyridoxamine 5'-phosphate oxidase family protein [Pedobacter sp. Leaf170]|uniref:pyridoxamine 5'-phosphate oxidase family protein n=1 Tax=Pedobacter sp. Leaf170 TaxID=2876558 RepID=UPI001E55AAB4|nr:pyridoxamine 5'-phosphate oxidase family protein [Pedobacter sp. Leaf170]
MGKFFNQLLDKHIAFIEKQKIFFTASAPLGSQGHVNLSPKGLDSFRVLGENKVAYMDLVGSGNETSAHLLENGRLTIMFCAFEGPPNILRLYCKGTTVLPSDKQWAALSENFNLQMGTRQIILADVFEVQTSCGFSVPYYDYAGERSQAQKWAENKGEEGLEQYKQEKNRLSLDKLPTALF